MPARLRYTTEPRVLHPGGLPRFTGLAVYSALLDAVRAVDGAMAKRLHDERPKSFAATPVLDARGRLPGPGHPPVHIEVGLLDDSLTRCLLEAVPPGTLLRIGHHSTISVTGVEILSAEPYSQILERAGPATTVSMRFVTPTTFRTAAGQGARRGRPFPVPELVFTNLATRWGRFASDVPLDLDAVGEVVFEHLEVSRFQLHTEEYVTRASETGCLGTVRYDVCRPEELPDASLRAISALAIFATFAGVGDRTNMGMGVIELMDSTATAPSSRTRRNHLHLNRGLDQ